MCIVFLNTSLFLLGILSISSGGSLSDLWGLSGNPFSSALPSPSPDPIPSATWPPTPPPFPLSSSTPMTWAPLPTNGDVIGNSGNIADQLQRLTDAITGLTTEVRQIGAAVADLKASQSLIATAVPAPNIFPAPKRRQCSGKAGSSGEAIFCGRVSTTHYSYIRERIDRPTSTHRSQIQTAGSDIIGGIAGSTLPPSALCINAKEVLVGFSTAYASYAEKCEPRRWKQVIKPNGCKCNGYVSALGSLSRRPHFSWRCVHGTCPAS